MTIESPIIMQGEQQNLVLTAEKHLTNIESTLQKNGAMLFRDFQIYSLSEFQDFATKVCDQLFDYTYRSTPRTKLGGKVYTSTEYPCDRSIPLHNENSYSLNYPEKILFFCAVQPKEGGETPIADSHQVYQLIDKKVRDKFIEKGVLYTRNFGHGLDLTWQQAFQTESRSEVEKICDDKSIEYHWLDNGILHTRQKCPAVITHPVSKKVQWFNQAHLFHQSANDEEMQQYFSKHFLPEQLPRNAFFGDGSAISNEEIATIVSAYQQAEIVFPWKRGDVLLLDNLAYAHGRKPFRGDRKIVVAMGN